MRNYVHHLPGRIRVRMPSVKGSVRNARTLESAFRGFKGVQEVSANPATGSVLIHYDPEQVNMGWMTALVRTDERASVTHKITDGIAGYVIQTAIERALSALVVALL